MKKYISELIGTFVLSLVVALAVGGGAFSISIPVLAAMIIGVFFYTIGGISGAHLNPSVTIAMIATKEIDGKQGIAYLASQFMGGAFALVVAGMFNLSSNLPYASISMESGMAEAVGAFVFALGFGSVYYKKVSSSISGAVVGISFVIGVSIAGLLGSYGFINPSISLASGVLDMFYLLGPIIGFTVGFMFYKWLIDSPSIQVQVVE